MTEKEQLFECYPQIHGKRFYLLDGKEFRDNNLIGEKSICFEEAIDTMNQLNDENRELKKALYLIDKLIDDLGHEEMKRQYKEITGDSNDR